MTLQLIAMASLGVATGLSLIITFIHVFFTPKFNYNKKHVVITGGSAGIGLELAKACVIQGANVTIVARNQANLDTAVLYLSTLKIHSDQVINAIAVDVSSSLEAVTKAFQSLTDVDVLINNAGTSINIEFDESTQEQFISQLHTNVLGSIYPTRALITQMKSRKTETGEGGRIVFVSSQMAQAALYGYTAYATSKWALRGFAEALHKEMLPYGILVSVAYPPDTNTPGYVEEMKTKSAISKQLSESGSVFTAATVAADILTGSSTGYFTISTGFDGWLLKHLHSGMTPAVNIFEVFQQILFCPLRIVAICYVKYWDYLCYAYTKAKDAKAKKST